jgi:hypothetical protein
MFIYRTIKQHEELWRVEDRAQLGCLKSLRAQATIRTVQEWIRRNLLWKQKIMSRVLNIFIQSMLCFIRGGQSVTVHYLSKGHILTPALKVIRWTSADCLLHWHTEKRHKNILFMDEKIFNIEEQYKYQSYKIYVQTSREVKENFLRVHKGHHPSYIMVWWKVSHHVVINLHSHKEGVKLVSVVYMTNKMRQIQNIYC